MLGVDCDRLDQRLTNPVGDQSGAFGIVCGSSTTNSSPASLAARRVSSIGAAHHVMPDAGDLGDAPRNLAQHAVAGFVPVLVVDAS